MADSTVSTKNIWPNYAAANVDRAAASSTGKSSLGKDDFLKILIAQLQNQDPSQPLQDKEFIAQMAQFSSVEQLSNMSKEMSLLRQSMGIASGLIGKQVTWSGTDETGQSVTKKGLVDAITFKEGTQYATVKGENITLDKLLTITNPE